MPKGIGPLLFIGKPEGEVCTVIERIIGAHVWSGSLVFPLAGRQHILVQLLNTRGYDLIFFLRQDRVGLMHLIVELGADSSEQMDFSSHVPTLGWNRKSAH